MAVEKNRRRKKYWMAMTREKEGDGIMGLEKLMGRSMHGEGKRGPPEGKLKSLRMHASSSRGTRSGGIFGSEV